MLVLLLSLCAAVAIYFENRGHVKGWHAAYELWRKEHEKTPAVTNRLVARPELFQGSN